LTKPSPWKYLWLYSAENVPDKSRERFDELTYFKHRITNAAAEGLNSKIATIQKRACGYRNPERFKIAVYFHCGGLNLWPPRYTH
jgi:hypothetical protein